jgi:hypothetical protein
MVRGLLFEIVKPRLSLRHDMRPVRAPASLPTMTDMDIVLHFSCICRERRVPLPSNGAALPL